MSEAPAPDDVAALRRELNELRTAHDALAAAQTPAEKHEAREDVAEAKADLSATAKTLGISPNLLGKAVADARKAERKEELRPILAELLEELADEDEEAEKTEPENAPAPKAPKAEKPAPDSEPTHPHWSERPVGELLRR
jgi:transposase-like protein